MELKREDDWRKRPLLTPEQLQTISRIRVASPKKGTPREEFEKLFRQATPFTPR